MPKASSAWRPFTELYQSSALVLVLSRTKGEVVRLNNHVAEVDPDAELDPLLGRGARVAVGYPPFTGGRLAKSGDLRRVPDRQTFVFNCSIWLTYSIA
jgi:hypothetical protein